MRLIYFVSILLIYPLKAAANTECVVRGASERLQNYCLQNTLSEKIVDYRQLLIVDNRMRLEGYKKGLGILHSDVAINPQSYAVLQPYTHYERNINGGNPAKPIVLEFGTFDDQTLYRRSGFTYGLGFRYEGRYLYGEGRYLNYSLRKKFAHDPYGSFNINTLIGEFCSYNHIQRSWYVDACISASQIHKDLSNEKWQNLSLSTSRLLKGAKGVNHEFSVGYNHYIGKIYEQSQVKLGIDTIFASGMFFGVDTTLGEIVSGHLATRYAFGVNATRFIAQKPVTISFAYKQSDGGSWLGVMRDEQSSSIQVKFPLWGAVSAVVGYNQTKSNVDYFDDAYPNFGLQLADIRF